MKHKFFATILSIGLAASSAVALAGHHEKCDGQKCELMKKLDTNGDGVVSKSEFMTKHEARFNKMDTDGNGELSAEEVKAGRSKMKEKFKDHKAKMMERKNSPEEESTE